jgi:hypothetical protein
MTQSIRVKKIRVGDDVPTYCGRCKAERRHIVAAMNSDTAPAEVICQTCHSKHRFRQQRAEGQGTTTRTPAVRRGGAGKKSTDADAAPSGPVRPYSPREAFAEGEWIEHSLHGTGKIKAVRDGKIDVQFGTGLRTLIHAR